VRRGLAILLVALAGFGLAACDTGVRDDNPKEANVSLRLAPDGALLVTEQLTFEYDGSFQASFRDIVLKHGEQITDVSVREGEKRYRPGGCTFEGCTDAEGTFGSTTIYPEGVRIVWHHKASDETRIFTVSYRVNRAVVAHQDVIDVGWQVWGDQWEDDLPRLTAEFANPALQVSDDDYRVWSAPRDVEGDTSREQGVARLSVSDIPSGQFVDFRVTVPRTPQQGVSAAQVQPGPGLPEIEESEQRLDDEYDKPFNKLKRWLASNSLLLALLLAGAAIGALILLTRLAREHPTSTPEHLPELPDDASPAVAYGLAHEGADSTNTVLATLLDLVERGYYDSKQATTEDEKLDLALSVASKRPKAELLPHEQEVLGFFDELLGSESVPISEMKDKIPEHSATWRTKWESMTAALDSAEEDQLDWDRNLNPVRWLMVPALLTLFAIVAVADVAVDEDASFLLPAAIGVVTIIVVMVWPSRRLKRLAPDFGERVSRWAAFERWTEDFPRLEDDPPATLDIWKKILIYGVAFGTAERMIESGRIPAPVMADSGTAWSTYYFSGGATDFGSSFSSGFSSQVAPESSSSGGGSFSGGGGGGFSGGGGGGSW
jgi:uncharacterized membrane protein